MPKDKQKESTPNENKAVGKPETVPVGRPDKNSVVEENVVPPKTQVVLVLNSNNYEKLKNLAALERLSLEDYIVWHLLMVQASNTTK